MNPVLEPEAACARWARMQAVGLWLSAAVLVVFGGAITTLRAGMAIDGWWVLDRGDGDHFLLAYPIEKWFASSGTFAEHTHRLIGVLVGLLSIGYVSTRWFERPRSGLKLQLALAALAAVCLQGAVGGFRVLENSRDLAFLHGALAQLVFALLGANAVVSSRAWDRALPAARGPSMPHPSSRAAWLVAAVVYAQSVLGAWLRHTGVEVALALHMVLAAVATAAVLSLSRSLRRAEPVSSRLARIGLQLRRVLVAQLALGLGALVSVFVVSGGFTAEVSALESITATGHVFVGALLLQLAIAGGMWIERLKAFDAQSECGATGVSVGWEGAR